MSNDYDVIVIGTGVAGLAASISAADAGARVLTLEADSQTGGSSRLSGGHFYAAGTSIQRAAGIVDDTPDIMFDHYMTFNQWLVEPSVVRRLCDLASPTLDWLQDQGVVFPVEELYVSGVGTVPRGHPPEGGGEAVVLALEGQLAGRGVDLALGTRVEEILMNDQGEVKGVRTSEMDVSCGAVIVATGGFGANPEMLQQHYPDAAAGGDWTWYIGSPMAQGDGLKLGQAVGAALDGHNRGLLLTTPGFSNDLEVLLPDWLILVNQAGRRFTDETAPYSVLAGLIQHQGSKVYAIFDEGARETAHRTPFFNAYWVDEILAAKADEGRIIRADTLKELAVRADINPDALLGTLERYNTDCAAGEDAAFFKQAADGLKPVTKAPYYAVEVRPAIICWTGTGLRIDADVRVLDQQERAIPGLYAAGETVGSLHGDRYIGGGGSFGPCIVFGKLAGEHAAAFANR